MMDFDMGDALAELGEAIEKASPALASAQRAYFDALVEEGFTEEQAMTIVTETQLVGDE